MSYDGSIYENCKPCEILKPSERCFVVEQYNEGAFLRKFHKHVPATRLSNEAILRVLRLLVIYFRGIDPDTIVNIHLHKRGRWSLADERYFRVRVTYPAPNVMRTYCGIVTVAWSDVM